MAAKTKHSSRWQEDRLVGELVLRRNRITQPPPLPDRRVARAVAALRTALSGYAVTDADLRAAAGAVLDADRLT